MVSMPETTPGTVELSETDGPGDTPGLVELTETDGPGDTSGSVDLNEAARQLELAVHDARVAFDCVGLADLDRAHTFAITARAAIDSAEHVIRAALTSRQVIQPDMDHLNES
jgi:hypothetical protein